MNMRFAFDVSKISSRDGLGSYSRGLLRAMAGLEKKPSLTLLNLLGAATEAELLAALEDLLGEIPESFELDLERWQDKSAAAQSVALERVDAMLATSWTVPASAPPSLFVVYDLTFFSHPHCHTLGNRLHCAEGLLRARLRGDAFTAISHESAAQLASHLGMPRGEILVAEPAVGDAFRPSDGLSLEHVARRHGLGEVHPEGPVQGFVLSVGSLEPRKNLGRLLAAHEQLEPATRRAFPLLLVGGGGWRSDDLEARITGSDPAHVKRLGSVTEEELIDLFSAATVFVYPSLAEGFGLPVLEAMACGAPVITSNRSSLPEVAGDAAILVDPLEEGAIATEIGRLLEDDQARRALGERGLERARGFSWPQTAARLLARLQEIAC